jgi:hypothetical protein
MGKLSELWFRLIEKIVNLIFLYIFCWWILRPFFDNLEHTIIHYLNHLSANSSNEGYSALKTMVRYVIDIINIILYVTPIITTLMFLNQKSTNKK